MIQMLKSRMFKDGIVVEVNICPGIDGSVTILLSPAQGGVYLNPISLRRREWHFNLNLEIKLDIVPYI